jgi:hypothetical protein
MQGQSSGTAPPNDADGNSEVTFRIKVSDYAKHDRSYFVDENGTSTDGDGAPDGAGCAGFGAAVDIGLLVRDRVFCALYELDGHMWLRIRQEKYCLSRYNLSPRHFIMPFVRRFTLLNQSSERVVDIWYRFLGLRDPFPDSGDFFELVTRSCQSPLAIARFTCYWKSRAGSAGPITEVELSRIEECVKQSTNRT